MPSQLLVSPSVHDASPFLFIFIHLVINLVTSDSRKTTIVIVSVLDCDYISNSVQNHFKANFKLEKYFD